jgi:hypothetical protein
MVQTVSRRGTGWIVFAAIVMILAGGNMLINGLWALHASNRVVANFNGTLLFSDNDLDVWGWIYVIVGAVVFVAGIAVFSRARWARWVGTVVAMVQLFFAFFWLFSPYWPSALVIIVLDMLVIHALNPLADEPVYGDVA